MQIRDGEDSGVVVVEEVVMMGTIQVLRLPTVAVPMAVAIQLVVDKGGRRVSGLGLWAVLQLGIRWADTRPIGRKTDGGHRLEDMTPEKAAHRRLDSRVPPQAPASGRHDEGDSLGSLRRVQGL